VAIVTFSDAGLTAVEPLFSNLTFSISANDRIGLIAGNGRGKTSFLNVVTGERDLSAGSVTRARGLKIGLVPQDVPAPWRDMSLDGLVREGLPPEQRETETWRVDVALDELQAPEALRSRPVSALSGGWQRLGLIARAWVAEPDLLLLDEPTNYLDLEGTLWLENYLANYPYTVVMISHDRNLLNKAVNSIVHLDHGKLTFYRGNYDTFETTRRMQMELAGKTRERTMERIAHMQSFVDRFRYKASKAKQAQARMKMIEKMNPPEALNEEHALPFSFPNPKKAMASPMLDFENVSVGYTEEPVLKKLNLRIEPDDRIALVGVNGNGKSTFAKLLVGDLKPMEGKIRRGRGFTTAYFAQHQLELLKPKLSAVEHVDEMMWDSTDAQRRSRVAQIGLSTEKMDTPAENLSGGERARLLLEQITSTKARPS